MKKAREKQSEFIFDELVSCCPSIGVDDCITEKECLSFFANEIRIAEKRGYNRGKKRRNDDQRKYDNACDALKIIRNSCCIQGDDGGCAGCSCPGWIAARALEPFKKKEKK